MTSLFNWGKVGCFFINYYNTQIKHLNIQKIYNHSNNRPSMHEELIKRMRAKLSLQKNKSTLVKKAQLIAYISQINTQNRALLYHLNKQEHNNQISINKLHVKQKQLQEVQHLLMTYELEQKKQLKQNYILKTKINIVQQYIQKHRSQAKIQSVGLNKKKKQKQGLLQVQEVNQQYIVSNDGQHAIIQLMKGFKSFVKQNLGQEEITTETKMDMKNSLPTFCMHNSQIHKAQPNLYNCQIQDENQSSSKQQSDNQYAGTTSNKKYYQNKVKQTKFHAKVRHNNSQIKPQQCQFLQVESQEYVSEKGQYNNQHQDQNQSEVQNTQKSQQHDIAQYQDRQHKLDFDEPFCRLWTFKKMK